jgi:transcriptional regulator with XRE-family HTH domain
MLMPVASFDFSPTIRQLTGSAQINQVQLALCAKVSPATASRWASGAATPNVDDLIRMRDCTHLPHWFRQACAEATAAGRAPGIDERAELDIDGDGRITMHDAEILDAQKQTVAARRHLRLEQEVSGGLTPDDLAEQLSLEAEEEVLSRRSARVLEIVACHGRAMAV